MKFKFNFLVYLILSLVFIFPMNFGMGYSAEEESFNLGDEIKKAVTPDKYKQGSQIQQTCAPFDVKDSLIFSTLTLCLPGILEKGMEWKQNKCQLVVCKYDAITNGLDPSFCEKQDAYRTCKYIVGEMFAIPPFSLVEFVRSYVAEILANPVGILWEVGTKAARKFVTNSCGLGSGSISCQSPVAGPTAVVLAGMDILGAYQTLQEIMENGFDYFSPGADYCERVPEIKNEMEKIINVLESEGALANFGGGN